MGDSHPSRIQHNLSLYQVADSEPPSANARPAEWLDLPQTRVIAIEHPCIVNDIDKGLKSLGGENLIKTVLPEVPKQRSSIGLNLRPHDPLAKKLVSKEVSVQNVLLRVSVPRRTGRKRKRGSNDPFASHQDFDVSSNDYVVPDACTRPLEPSRILRRMQDNPDKYSVQPIGHIKETHRWRALPDFQAKTGTQTVMREIGRHLLDPSLTTIKRFNIDLKPGVKPGEDILPPPNFTAFEQPLTYGYRQNQGLSTITDEKGQKKTINTQKLKRRAVLAVPADTPTVPAEPPPGLTPLDETNAYLRQAVKNIAELLNKRPVVTRRVAMNLIDWGSESLFKEATQYVGFSFKSGPWRDALVKYGIDPRTDPQYRIYQTLSFQLLSKDLIVAEAKKMPDGKNAWVRSERYRKDKEPSHIFDGKGITTNGKTWQICDISEPLIRRLLDTDNLRTECDMDGWGWFQNGTMSKVRIIMRDMISMMLMGKTPDFAAYETLSRIPDIIDPVSYTGCYFDKDKDGEKAVALSSNIRNHAKTDLIMKVKTREAVTADEDGVRKGGLGGVLDGATEEDNDDDGLGDVEGDDLNGSASDEGHGDDESAEDGASDDMDGSGAEGDEDSNAEDEEEEEDEEEDLVDVEG